MNLTYRIERLLHGERGIVLKVEPISPEVKRKYGPLVEHERDYSDNLPDMVTFMNPLGQVLTRLAPIVQWTPDYSRGRAGVPARDNIRYRKYSPGDKFP